KVTANGLWLNGYYHWVPAGGDTGPRKFALWQLSDTTHGVSQTLVPGGTVTSGTLTANQWNFVPLPAPIGLSGSVPYVACYGYVAVNGFPDTQNQFGSGQPYAAGITNGPLFAYSDQGASAPEPSTSNYDQGLFSVAGSDPAAIMPVTGDSSSNFWIDVQVTSQPPGGASYRLWPSQPYAVNWVNDTADNFTLGCEFTLAQACTLDNIWFYSPAGVTQLPTECGIWNVTTQALVSGTDNAAPSWSGAAGSGWVSVPYSGVTLPAGDYKVAVVNAAGTPAIWNPTTDSYWGATVGVGGIANGPLSAPDTTHATSPGQDTYNAGAAFTYPLTYSAPANGANYWVDVEVTPVPATAGAAAITAAGVLAAAAAQGAAAALDAAGVLSGTGSSQGGSTTQGSAVLAAAGRLAAPAVILASALLAGRGQLTAVTLAAVTRGSGVAGSVQTPRGVAGSVQTARAVAGYQPGPRAVSPG